MFVQEQEIHMPSVKQYKVTPLSFNQNLVAGPTPDGAGADALVFTSPEGAVLRHDLDAVHDAAAQPSDEATNLHTVGAGS
jgi:hypothetical protein